MKNQKGITLISLVITIVVLIILAGVAVNMTIGENGIFTKAQEAKKAQAIGAAKEQIGLEILEAQIEKMENNEELEQAEVEEIVAKYGVLQSDEDTIILNDSGYEVSLKDIYNTMVEAEGDETTELAQLKALLAQTTVTEDKMLKNYKAYKDGQLITGTMEDYSGITQEATATSDDNYTYLSIPNAGYYSEDSKLKISNVDVGSDVTYKGPYYIYPGSAFHTTFPVAGWNTIKVKSYTTNQSITWYDTTNGQHGSTATTIGTRTFNDDIVDVSAYESIAFSALVIIYYVD